MKDSFYWQAPEWSVKTPRQALRSDALMSAGIVISILPLVTLILIVVNRSYLEPFLTWPGYLIPVAAAAFSLAAFLWIGALGTVKTDEEAIKRIPALGPLMTIPMILLVLPALFMVLLGPAALKVVADRGETQSVAASASQHLGPTDVGSCIAYGTKLAHNIGATEYVAVVSSCRTAFPER